MNQLSQIPLARLAVPFIIGVAAAIWLQVIIPTPVFWALAFIFITALFITHYTGKAKAVFGAFVILLFVLMGIKITEVNTVSGQPTYFKNLVHNDNYELIVTLAEPPQTKAKTIKATLAVTAIKQENIWQNCSGKILSYIAIDSISSRLKYGSTLHIKTELADIEGPKNPGQFDYKYYLQNKGIYHQCYLKSGAYEVLKQDNGNIFYSWANNARASLIKQLKQSGLSGQELAVASALLLGYDDDIDNELLQGFSASGTMHVLSVSGMHAGLVYLLFTWLLQFIGESMAARVSRVVIIILALWAYALITGFSPPVIRAAVMFSLLSVGQSLNRYTNPINILAGSCLGMLAINPLLLADVGFQLSYLAVLGINLLYRPVYNLLESKHFVIDYIWQLTAMSLVAQLVTFPLGLLYFHQFPNYFIISNLLIIPLSTAIIFGGIVLLAISFIQPVATVVGYLLSKLISLLNWLVIQNKSLPFATTSNVNLSLLETFIIYTVIVVLSVGLYYKKKQWLYAGITVLLVFFTNRIYYNTQVLQQQKLIVYHTPKSTAVEVISGNTATLITDSINMPGTRNFNFNIAGSNWYYDVANRTVIPLSSKVLQYNGKNIAIVANEVDLSNMASINYLVIANNPKLNFEAIKKLNPELVIFSNNNRPAKVEQWQHECVRLGIANYNLATENAFIADF